MKIILLAISLFLFGCTSAPTNNIKNEVIPTGWSGKDFAIEEIEKAILSASQKRGWSSRIVRPGLIEARISVRTHRAEISIPYSKSNYSIYYKSSEKLGHRNERIHRNYNNWVTRLSQSIQREGGGKN